MNAEPSPAPHRLMVVDNDPDFADSLCDWITTSSDWTAVPAYGLAQAVACASDAPFDAILLDLQLLGVDGFETAATLEPAGATKHAAILGLTGNADLRDAAAADDRFAASLLKPANPDQLFGVLASLAHPA